MKALRGASPPLLAVRALSLSIAHGVPSWRVGEAAGTLPFVEPSKCSQTPETAVASHAPGEIWVISVAIGPTARESPCRFLHVTYPGHCRFHGVHPLDNRVAIAAASEVRRAAADELCEPFRQPLNRYPRCTSHCGVRESSAKMPGDNANPEKWLAPRARFSVSARAGFGGAGIRRISLLPL